MFFILILLIFISTYPYVISQCAFHQPDADAVIGVSICFSNPGHGNTGCDKEGYSHVSECYQSMLWAVDMLNQDNGTVFGREVKESFIPGVKLGLKAYDDCGRTNLAIQNIDCMLSKSCDPQRQPYLLGVIGSCGVQQTQKIAKKLSQKKIPLLSSLFGALSRPHASYSDTPYLYEVFPNNGLDELIQTIVSLIKEFNWIKVTVLYEDDLDWKPKLVKLFVNKASANNICIGDVIKVPTGAVSHTYLQVVKSLLHKLPTTGVIYLGARNITFSHLLSQAKTLPGSSSLHWIIYEIDNLEVIVENHIDFMKGTILVQHNNIRPKSLLEYIYKKSPLQVYENDPWFPNYFMKTKQCSLPNASYFDYYPSCSSYSYNKEFLLTFAFHPSCMNSIFIFANAFKKAWEDKCGGRKGVCSQLKTLSKSEFNSKYLHPTYYTYNENNRGPPEFYNVTINFDLNKRLIWKESTYGIRNLQVKKGFKYPKVFTFRDGRLKKESSYQFYDSNGSSLPVNSAPPSPCKTAGCSNDRCLTT